MPKLTRVVDGELRFDQPAAIAERVHGSADFVRACLESYRRSLEPQVRALYDRYDVLDVAFRVVGVGSVGLGAFVTLLEADGEIVILQLKQARASVLEAYCGRAGQRNAGQRVVVGQRTMQAASDLFLGWLRTPDGDDYYVRQLHDMKGSAPLEKIDAAGLAAYAWVCGAILARAHARSGDAAGDHRLPRQPADLRRRGRRLCDGVRGHRRARLRGLHRGDRGGAAGGDDGRPDAALKRRRRRREGRTATGGAPLATVRG